jgi:hypothetical protein
MTKPRTIMIYGNSGDSKTTQAYFLAKYIHEKTGLTGRLIGTNASDSAPFEDSGMIDKGVVDFFDISNRVKALADMRRLSEGYWPRDIQSKPTGNKEYFATDDKCLTSQDQWKKLGFYIIEGAAGIANLLLNHIRQQEEGVGFKHSFKYEEDGYIIGGLQEGHYGLVQQEMYKLIVQGFACLPVKYIIMTSLIAKGVDKRVSETVYGPKSAGQATTFEIPSWFMDCFHLDSVIEDDAKNPGQKVSRKVAWFEKHLDTETQIPYLCKVRMLPEIYTKLYEAFPNGYVPLGFKSGLDKMYRAIDIIVEKNKEGKG